MKIKIAKQHFFNNGDLLLEFLKDSEENLVKEDVSKWLNGPYNIEFVTRKNKTEDINASILNKQLRAKISVIKGVHQETHVLNNGFSHKAIKGFDFSLYDEMYNLIQIRNYYIGEHGCIDGEHKLEKAYRDFGATSKCWKEKISEIKGIVGEDYSISSKKSLTLVGELQFGNWALGYYDLLRLINATETVPIDYYIYVAATGKLEKCLSDGIVTYNKMLGIVKENQRIVKVPMWLIGIDIDDETPKII